MYKYVLKHPVKSVSAVMFFLLFVWWCFALPNTLFSDPCSTVLEDRDGNLLGASVAKDGQWRFPARALVPDKYKICLIAAEDRHFRQHPGINPVAIVKAAFSTIAGGRKRGGSTITMQVMRMARHNPPRTVPEKVLESLMALRLEVRYSKDEILGFYAAHAPFGGNVVGLEAACRRWFGTSASGLSWAEAATLAVLPNNPALIYPGKNRKQLIAKRNRLLQELHNQGTIDALTLQLALEEPEPGPPARLPDLAPHLLQRAIREGFGGTIIRSTISLVLQQKVQAVTQRHHTQHTANGVFNASVLVCDVNSGAVRAYIGNTNNPARADNADFVDMTDASRSYGSLLKPLLFASALDEGLICPSQLLPDVPGIFGSYAPRNFSDEYNGVVPASEALSRSLNVPFVSMQQSLGTEKFLFALRSAGISTLQKPARHYGLSLVLGGGEAKLWELTGMYASMARKLKQATGTSIEGNLVHPPVYSLKEDESLITRSETGKTPVKTGPVLHVETKSGGKGAGQRTDKSKAGYVNQQGSEKLPSAGAIYATLKALLDNNRPGPDANRKEFALNRPISWKTGTSQGLRDAWSIGITPDYVIAVWVGNADGEGRPGLTGIEVAAPLMFNINRLLPEAGNFKEPRDLVPVAVCAQSGCKANTGICPNVIEELLPKGCTRSLPCTYHQVIHTDMDAHFRVNSDCEQVINMKHLPWFVLPPVQAWYYRRLKVYNAPPPVRADCIAGGSQKNGMAMVYPGNGARIRIPAGLNGKPGQVVFELVHNNKNATVWWHLDGKFIGISHQIHQTAQSPAFGQHTLSVIDDEGQIINTRFSVE